MKAVTPIREMIMTPKIRPARCPKSEIFGMMICQQVQVSSNRLYAIWRVMF